MIMDEIDKEIILQLQKNGRTTLSELGKRVGMTHVGVKRRIDRLIKADIIKVVANVNVDKLGYKSALILVEVENYSRLQELINMFKDCPRIICLATLSGAYNLMVLMVAEDIDTLESMILGECSIRGQKGIRRSDVQIISSFVFPQHHPVRMITERKKEIPSCGLDCGKCERYTIGKCLGCPLTEYYRARS